MEVNAIVKVGKELDPFFASDGTPSGEYELDLEVPDHDLLEDMSPDNVVKHALDPMGARWELFDTMTIEDLVDAIAQKNTGGGQWEYIDRPKLLEAMGL